MVRFEDWMPAMWHTLDGQIWGLDAFHVAHIWRPNRRVRALPHGTHPTSRSDRCTSKDQIRELDAYHVVHNKWPYLREGGLPHGAHPTTRSECWRPATWCTYDSHIWGLGPCHIAHIQQIDLRDEGLPRYEHLKSISESCRIAMCRTSHDHIQGMRFSMWWTSDGHIQALLAFHMAHIPRPYQRVIGLPHGAHPMAKSECWRPAMWRTSKDQI
jgi:hypothetical protein